VALEAQACAGIFAEIPSNALLKCPDLKAIYELSREFEVPLVCDDTIGTSLNIEVEKYSDLVVSSLTKAYAGSGSVMAGSLTLIPSSPFYSSLQSEALALDDTSLFSADLEELERLGRDYEERFFQMEETAEQLVDYLKKNFPIQELNYPKLRDRENFEAVRRPSRNGYGFLFSFVLKDAETKTQPFYDALEFCKGPSLGTNFSLVCPYTMLAHFHELPVVEPIGLSPYLIRVSVGLESLAELKSRFKAAFDSIA